MPHRSTGRLCLILVCCLTWPSCSPASRPGGPRTVTVDWAPAEQIAFSFTVYLLPRSTRDTSDVVDRILAEHGRFLIRAARSDGAADQPRVAADIVDDVPSVCPPPDADLLQHCSRGLDAQQINDLQQSARAVRLTFGAPQPRALATLRAANAIVGAIAQRQQGIVWDDETREAFSAAAWHERRIDGWPDDIPDVSKQMTMHAYQEGEFVRIVTLGMAKFGLPDIAVEQSAWSEVRSVGNLINVTAQSLVEGMPIAADGTLHLDLRSLQNAAARDAQVRTLKSNATGTAEITVANAAPQPGDAPNRLLKLRADRYPGGDEHARQTALLTGLFGSEDRIDRIQHDEEILDASRRAREQLPRLRAALQHGLEPGEHILVKAPFRTTDGADEWMWVEVAAWDDTAIRGTLQNEPFDVPGLRAGQIVDVDPERVFDYIHSHADGELDGNETGRILEARRQSPNEP